MKDSSIPWLGEIPEHWDICFFKRLVRIYNGSDYKHIQVDEGGFPVIGSGGEFARASDFLYDGEAIFIGRKGTIDKPFYFRGKFWAIDTIFYCVPQNKANGKYFYYQATTFPYERYITSTAKPSLTQTDLGDFVVVNPPLPEQKAIAEYLDKRCAEIDELIGVEEKIKAELQAYKQSIITETVTRGLNPNVPMKESETQWIEEIPQHWELKPLKFFCSSNDETLSETTSPDCTIKYVEISDVDSVYGIKRWTEYDFKDAPSRARRVVRKNDIIISTVRTYLRAIAIIKEDDLIISTGFSVIRPYSEANSDFVAYSLRSEPFVAEVIANSVGISYPAISSIKLISIKTPLPPLSEQQAIVEYLDKRCSEIDSLVEVKQQKIDELKEYKQSVIYEYVTGKKEIH